MSYVTNVVLMLSLLEEEGDDQFPAVEILNAWLMEHGKGKLERVDNFSGGNKAFEAAIFMGAFNYLGDSEFIAAVGKIPWKDRENVQLFIKDENDDRFASIENSFLP